MKLPQITKLTLAIAGVLAVSELSMAQLVIDDFSTGAITKTLKAGSVTDTETGSMIGGNRETVFLVCATSPCGAFNPYSQPATFEVRGETKSTPAALIQSAGYKVGPRIDVIDGSTAVLNLNLSSTYDRFRLTFDGSDLNVNFNIQVFTGTLYSQTGCNIAASINSFTIKFPFADLTPGGTTTGAFFSDITLMDFIFQTESSIGGNSWAVTFIRGHSDRRSAG